MKKALLSLVTLLLTHNHVKVWCKTKEKYYEVITDKLYQIGEVIKIK